MAASGTAGQPAGGDRELVTRLAAIVRSASDSIVSMTQDGIVTSWNAGATAMFGYAADEVVGRPISVLFPPGRANELAPILGQIRRGGRVAPYESKLAGKDGTMIDASVSVSPLRDDGAAIAGAVAVVRDVTERNWAEAERRESDARRYHAERMESLGRLAGAIGADLTELTRDIMRYADVAAEVTSGHPDSVAGVRKIQAAAGRAARLAHELLVFSRRDPTSPGQVDLNAVLTGIHDLLEDSAGGRVGLRLSTTPGLPAVLADRGQIQQALLELAENARHAMPCGGTLTFTTRLVEASKLADAERPGAGPGQYVEVAVSDTGYGMDAATMRHAFEPFFTTKPPGQGAGLGLSTVYGVITKAGGGITIESEEGVGTTFHVYLPPAHRRAPAAPARFPASGPGHGETILVVGDQPATLEITARILRHNGYRPLVAGTAEQALELLAAHDVQLLLTGSPGPGATGPGLADRALQSRPGIQVLRMPGVLPGGTEPEPAASADAPRIQNQLTARDLLEKVRAALGAERRE